MYNGKPYVWRRPADKYLAIGVAIVLILFLAGSVLNSMCNLGIFSENQKPQPFGAPFGGLIFFGIMFIRFIVGLVTIFASFFIRKYRWIFAIIGSMLIIYSIAYPYVLFTGDYSLQQIERPFEKDAFWGVWKDDSYKLSLYGDGNFKFEFLHHRNTDGTDSCLTGSWYIENEDILLRQLGLKKDIELDILKYHDKYYLSYNLPPDLDAWDGYLGLIHIKDSIDYSVKRQE